MFHDASIEIYLWVLHKVVLVCETSTWLKGQDREAVHMNSMLYDARHKII